MRRRRPEREEWDFREVMPGEEKAACVWEYAREFPELRKPGALDKLPQTREVEWLRKLNFIFGKAFLKESCFLAKPWIIASREWHEQLPDIIQRHTEQCRQIFDSGGIKPDPRPVDAPIELPDRLAAAIVYRAALKPGSDRIPVEIDLTASKKDVLDEVEKILNAAPRRRETPKPKRAGIDKESDWQGRLDALGIMRLRRCYRFGEIVELLKGAGDRIQDPVQELKIERRISRKISRAKRVVHKTYALLHLLPLPERFR